MSDVGEFDTPTAFVVDCFGITSPMAGFGWYKGLLCSTEGSSKLPEFGWLTSSRAAGSKKDLAAGTELYITGRMKEVETSSKRY